MPGPLWELAPQVETMAEAGGRERSQHFGATVERAVRVNDAAAGYRALGAAEPLPPGAVVLQFHFAPGAVAPTGAFAMTKRPSGSSPTTDDWEYLVLDRELRVLARGPLAPCARCHASAPSDSLFGAPGAR